MDDGVQQCPNCGAAVLPSARFCVTCGIRLPDPPDGSGNGDPRPSGWAQPAEDVWIGEAPALDDESEQRLADDFQRDQQSATTEAGSTGRGAEEAGGSEGVPPEDAVIALPPTAPDKPQATAWFEARDDAESAAAGVTPDAVPDQLAADIGPSSVAGDASALSDDEPAPVSGPHAGVPESESEAEQVGPEGELTDLASGTGSADTTTNAESWPITSDQAASSSASGAGPDDHSLEPDAFEPAGWEDSDDRVDDVSRDEPTAMSETHEPTNATTADPAPASQPGRETGEPGSDLDRATTLLRELSDLLPRIAAPAAPPEQATDLAALRERALMVRGDHSFDDFAALRDVVSDAVNRPRDIEVVLRLSQRTDDIDALLKERDRLDAALNELLAGLDQ